MYTSILTALLPPLLLPLPIATSLTIPSDPSLSLTPTNNTPTSPPPPSNPWPPTHTYPPTPFALPIPSQDPPAHLTTLHLFRPGLKRETDSLLALISAQLAHYASAPGLPGPFTLVNADVRFWLRLATPKRGEGWLSRGLAVGALEVLGGAVGEAGAREGVFVVEERGGGVKGTMWVGFVDEVGG